jgi:hypothetical protein
MKRLWSPLLLLTLFATAGCMSVRPPEIARQSGAVEPSTTLPPKVLLIYQVNLERKSFVTSTPEKAEAIYHLAGAEYVKRIAAMGGSADYKVSSDDAPPEIPKGDYTHVSMQKITRLSVDNYGNAWNRTWDSSLYVLDRSGAGIPPRRAANQVYHSDGIRCFSISQYANRVECQVKYMDHLVAQVAPVFPKK